MIWGSFRWGAAAAQAANLEENSPKLRCWLCASISPKVAASQKHVVPPLPSTTSYPSGSEKRSQKPRRTRPTCDLTVFWRWLVPRYVVATSASAVICSGRTLEGPDPKRPSVGLSSAGMMMSGVSGTYGIIASVTTTPDAPPQLRRISRRAAAVAPSATLAVDAKAKALQAAGEHVIGFGAGEPDFPRRPTSSRRRSRPAATRPTTATPRPQGSRPCGRPSPPRRRGTRATA